MLDRFPFWGPSPVEAGEVAFERAFQQISSRIDRLVAATSPSEDRS